MNQDLANQVYRAIADTHACAKKTTSFWIQFRYNDAARVTAEAIKEIARACVRKSDLSNALDLKTKCGSGNVNDASQERTILVKIIAADDNSINDAMHELINFYSSISERGASCKA